MDGSRFDEITRALARPRSRRGFLASAAAVAGGILGGRAAVGAAPSCREAGHPCEGNQTCCDGLVCIVSGPGNAARCTPCPPGQIACGGVCILACTASDQCHVAGVCDPTTQSCTNPTAPDNTPCNDGDACTQTDTCQAGACVGSNPVVCTALDQCHVPGVCDPATGTCSNPAAPDGTGCDDGDACTQSDTCQAGACVGSNPVVCTALDQCHVVGVCDPDTGLCSNPPAPDNSPCDDGDACTQTDTCQGGSCVGGNPVVCPTPDQCHTLGTCDPDTGTCSNPVAPLGTACDDQDPCTEDDACRADGTCAGTAKICTDNNICTTDTCNATSGVCEFTPVPNNTVACPTASGAPGRCTDGRCCAPPLSVCNVTADCCLGTNVCVNGTCQPSPQCNRPLQRVAAPQGGGSAGTSLCQRTPTSCEQTLNVTLTGAPANTTYRAIIDQNSAGQPTSHIDVGFFTTDASGNATFTGTITVSGTCPSVVDNEIVLEAGAFNQHQFIQQSFQPCTFCTT